VKLDGDGFEAVDDQVDARLSQRGARDEKLKRCRKLDELDIYPEQKSKENEQM
jgi:hypothetical protein